MNILAVSHFSEGFSASFRSRLRELCPNDTIHFLRSDELCGERYHRMLSDCEIIIGHLPPEDLRFCKRLKLMQMDIAGAESYLSCPYFPESAVLCNASGAYGVILAEHAVAMIMALCRDLPRYAENRLRRLWQPRFPDKPIEGSTVLILGAGDIGMNTARLLRPLARRIIGVRRVKRDTPEDFDEMISFDELDELLPQADIISCSLPATKETFHLLDERRLRLMKQDAVLVNVGRGSLIPTEALCRVLNEGLLRGVGLDVTELEPLPEDSPLWDCERLIITPHTAGSAADQDSPTCARIYDVIFRNIENYLAGNALDHVVDRRTGYRTTAENIT